MDTACLEVQFQRLQRERRVSISGSPRSINASASEKPGGGIEDGGIGGIGRSGSRSSREGLRGDGEQYPAGTREAFNNARSRRLGGAAANRIGGAAAVVAIVTRHGDVSVLYRTGRYRVL